MNNINPLLELSPQAKTAIALSDALFGGVKVRKPTTEDRLDEAIALANRLELLIHNIAREYPDNSNLDEAQDMVGNAMLDLIGARKEIFAPYVSHEPKCGCDSCVAARSDEHYSRKIDGELCEGRR